MKKSIIMGATALVSIVAISIIVITMGGDSDGDSYTYPTVECDSSGGGVTPNQTPIELNGVVSDHGITDEMVFQDYSEYEMNLISQQQGLYNAISGAYSYTPQVTANIHCDMDDIFENATTVHTYVSDTSDTSNGDLTNAVTYTGYIHEGIVGFNLLPTNVQRVIRLMPESEFEYLFPVRHESYEYVGLLKAIAKWPKFCGEYNEDLELVTTLSSDKHENLDKVCAAEIASMFAHFAQEVGAHYSGDIMAASADGYVSNGSIVLANPDVYFPTEEWRQALYHVEEAGYAGTDNVGYRLCTYGTFQAYAFPCGDSTASYHGRGAKQLSYNYNYAPFSRLMYGDMRLLDTPELVAEDGFLALSSAVYFYMMPRTPKPSIHETVVGLWQPTDVDLTNGREFGFGVQTLIINGGVECGGEEAVQQSVNRANYFQGFAEHFGAWDGWYDGGKQLCTLTQVFDDNDTDSPYFYKGYYTEDWFNVGDCFLVGWEETGFSAFFPGDAHRCADSEDKKSFPDEDTAYGTIYYYQNAYFEYTGTPLSQVVLYDSGTSYFVNKLVQDKSGNVYRARRTVPSGKKLSNNTYWEKTGSKANGVYTPTSILIDTDEIVLLESNYSYNYNLITTTQSLRLFDWEKYSK